MSYQRIDNVRLAVDDDGVPQRVELLRVRSDGDVDVLASLPVAAALGGPGELSADQPVFRAAARLTVVDKVRADALTDEQVASVAPLFDPWQPGLDVKVGDVLSWDGTLVEVIQAHTTQADWEPHLVPALWKIHRTDDGTGPIPWQPGISVVAGEQVTYDGVTYDVVQSHTTQTGWEPPATPSLFTPAA